MVADRRLHQASQGEGNDVATFPSEEPFTSGRGFSRLETRRQLRKQPALSTVPFVIVSDEDLRQCPIDNRGGFLLSLIDGETTIEDLLDLSGMSAEETLGLLENLVEQRIVALR